MKQKVIIDPASRIFYASFYIQGLYEVFGKEQVSFSTAYFKDLDRHHESSSFDHYMAFVVITKTNTIIKYIIDYRDFVTVKKNAYDWCDVYAKINFNKDSTEAAYHEKMISIGPGFGIRIWNFWETAFHCLANLLRLKFNPLYSIKGHLIDYKYQHDRPTLEEFTRKIPATNADKTYVFLIGTLWRHQTSIDGVNMLRKKFIEACKDLNYNFEGGFFASKDHPTYEAYKDVIFTRFYDTKAYIAQTKLSAVVFNTPAVHNCHGWKLGESLAMGKAIITTEISNELPEPLVHGEDVHIIAHIDEIRPALEQIISDESYKTKLETASNSYYEKYISPSSVIKRMLAKNS